jgi:Na+/H+-dicarboxylate symporter
MKIRASSFSYLPLRFKHLTVHRSTALFLVAIGGICQMLGCAYYTFASGFVYNEE